MAFQPVVVAYNLSENINPKQKQWRKRQGRVGKRMCRRGKRRRGGRRKRSRGRKKGRRERGRSELRH